MSGAYSCAQRAADPANQDATCRQWCGNAETCPRSEGAMVLMPAQWTEAMDAEFLRHVSEFHLTPIERRRERWRRLVAAFGAGSAA